jgi:hypothetical protein
MQLAKLVPVPERSHRRHSGAGPACPSARHRHQNACPFLRRFEVALAWHRERLGGLNQRWGEVRLRNGEVEMASPRHIPCARRGWNFAGFIRRFGLVFFFLFGAAPATGRAGT